MRATRCTFLCCVLAGMLGWLALPRTAFAQGQTQTQEQAPASGQAPAGAPVIVRGKTLFVVRGRLFTFSPEDRARTISQRIAFLSQQPLSRIREVTVVEEENTSEIVAGDLVIMTVTNADASAAGRSRPDLAQVYAGMIRDAAETLQRQYSLRTILLALLYAALATAGFALSLRLIGFSFRKLYVKLESWHGVYIRSIRIQKLELLPAKRILGLLRTLARLARLAATLVLLYFYVTLMLSFFPWTRGYSSTLFEYVLSPIRAIAQSIASYLPNIFFIAVILVIAYYAIKFVKFIFTEIGRETISLPGFYPEWAMPTYKIARFLLIAFTAMVVYPYLPGSRTPAFQGISIFLGLLFSLGSSSAIANVVAGSVLTYTRAFQVGDRIKIGDATGDVIEKTLLVTRVRTIKNEDISIPNAMVLSSQIVNFSSAVKDHGLILHTGVTIGYDAPWRTVHSLLIDAALATENIAGEPKPFVLQTRLDDFYVHYELNAFTDKPAVMARTYSDLHQNIQDKFNEAGVEIMSPHYGALRDGNRTAIPSDYLPKEHPTSAFRILPLDRPSTDK
jgi:small-conductance mechanosensitive channel